MINKDVSISRLQVLFSQLYGKDWVDFEPETLMMELGNPDYLVMEKIFVLQALNKNANGVLAIPEFVSWLASVCNNEYAEFEILTMPNSLELAWAIDEVKRVCKLSGQVFKPQEELIDVLVYLLIEDGFSAPLQPFEFIPADKFTPGASEEDVELKKKGIYAYLDFMIKHSGI